MYFLKKEKNNVMDNLNDLFGSCFAKEFKTDIIDRKNEYLVLVELPGVNKENIDLKYANNYLTITVSNNHECEDSNDDYIRKERYNYSSTRSFYLENVDENKITAKLDNGVLNVVVKKLEVTSKDNKILID